MIGIFSRHVYPRKMIRIVAFIDEILHLQPTSPKHEYRGQFSGLFVADVNLKQYLIDGHFKNGCHFEVMNGLLPVVIPDVEKKQ